MPKPEISYSARATYSGVIEIRYKPFGSKAAGSSAGSEEDTVAKRGSDTRTLPAT